MLVHDQPKPHPAYDTSQSCGYCGRVQPTGMPEPRPAPQTAVRPFAYPNDLVSQVHRDFGYYDVFH